MNLSEILKILFWVLVVSGTVFFFTKSLKRLFQVTSGLFILEFYNSVWDIGIWPVIQGLFGVYGIIGLTLIALVLNFAVLRWYQKYCKTDWLGITIVEDIIHKAKHIQCLYNSSKGFRKILIAIPTMLLWVAQKCIIGKWVPILVLSLFTDGFVATAYFINWKNKTMNCRLGRDEYFVLGLTTIVSCVAWSIFTEWITLPAFKTLWQTFAD